MQRVWAVAAGAAVLMLVTPRALSDPLFRVRLPGR
jgi:hypothetical protein